MPDMEAVPGLGMGSQDGRPVVILADDDAAITFNLAPFLERAGLTVHVAGDGEAVLELVERLDPDGCVLDVLMPRLDGREVLRRLRAGGHWLPVVLLTQVGESAERAIALDEGADDYLNKPFDPYELLARLRAVLRRARPGRRPLSASPALRAGNLRMDRISRRAWLRDTELVLTPKAMLLLDYLLTHPDELLTRDRLLEVLWGLTSRSERVPWTTGSPSCGARSATIRWARSGLRPCPVRATGSSRG